MQSIQLKTLLAPWLLPPASLLLLAALGLLFSLRWPRFGRWLCAVALVIAFSLTLPIASNRLMAWVEAPYARLDPAPLRMPTERQQRWRARPGEAPQAIVVLAGGLVTDGDRSPVPNRIGSRSLERVLHAHRLARLTDLPLLITGGVPSTGEEAEALVLRDVLVNDFGQPVRWLEIRSRDTLENARFSARILSPQGIKRILLVTHAFHMRRAQETFENAGFVVFPAPHAFRSSAAPFSLLHVTPSIGAAESSNLALHEIIGQVWYRFEQWKAAKPAR